ncbi:MAG: glycosyltransferase [Methanobrevibacter sp.]|nr:glycosyltransferase [Methanobrevibacter sp.]
MILSIIIPTYNEEEYLPVLLDSIKKQNFEDYEVIIADANSTDKTREIASEYGCIITEGGMPAVGRNNGAKIAKGEYLLFLDSDLKLTDDYLRDTVYEFQMERLGIAITQMKALSKKSEDQLLHYLANQFMIGVEKIKPHGAGCYGIIAKKELHEKCGGFNEDLTFGEDSDYIKRLGKVERFKVLRKPRIGVSTRRLEEEGIDTLIRQYGKSTFNDFVGKETDAEELNYNFGHDTEGMSKENLDKFSLESKRITKMFEDYDKSVEKVNTARTYFKRTKKDRNKKIVFYCVCGEGMGHAIRSGVIIDRIKEKYDVYVFSHDRAYEYLNEKFDHVYEIGGFNTVYINNKVDNTKTLISALHRNPTNIKVGYQELYKKARSLSPDVIVTDFEIYATMVSKLLQIPLISLDNIHMITQTKIDYPPHHQTEMLKAKGVIKSYVVRPKFHILTSFFFPKVRPRKNAVIYPPVIREEIYNLKPTIEDHIVVYQTSKESVKLVESLKTLDENFIVYGFNEDKTDENLTYKSFNEDEFYDDLASAKAVVCNGGFTFISEAITLKKPIYSVPAIGNFEQTLNGFYVQKLGYGEYHENMSPRKLRIFLKRLDKYQNKLNKVKRYNNDGIVRELEYRIEKYSRK